MRLLFLTVLASACTSLTPAPTCTDPQTVLVAGDEPLTCATVGEATAYVRLLAGRPVYAAERGRVVADIVAHYGADPADTRADLVEVARQVAELEAARGIAAGELRSTRVWEALNGQGPLDEASYADVNAVLKARIAPWASDDADKLVLTEQDVEGWISFASLCREVQAGGPLKLSIANRELVYRDVREHFDGSDRTERIGMVSMGAFWPQVASRWKSASYEEQQAWIKDATLPPPMTATSLGYAAGVFELPFGSHARTVHQHFGPLSLDAAR